MNRNYPPPSPQYSIDPDHQTPRGGLRDQSHIGLGGPPLTYNSNRRAVSFDTATPNRDAFGRSTSLAQDGPAHHNPGGLVNTPTPANRYYTSTRLIHEPPIQENPMDKIIGMLEHIMKNNHDLKDRVASLKDKLSSQPSSTRGVAAHRRKPTQTRANPRRGQHRVEHVSDTSDPDANIDPALRALTPAHTAHIDTNASDTDLDSAGGDFSETDDLALTKPERTALQKHVTQVFRRVCDIHGKNWPDSMLVRTNDITGKTYPTPWFEQDVTDTHNDDIVMEVANRVMTELEERNCWPDILKKRPIALPRPTWDLSLLVEMSKKGFRSLRRSWTRSHSEFAAHKAKKNARAHRQKQRRIRKSEQIAKVVHAYAEKYGLDPKHLLDIIHEEYLSDEVSGPDENTNETKQAWQIRMAAKSGRSDRGFLEVLVPPWRSQPYTDIIHALEKRWFNHSLRNRCSTSCTSVSISIGLRLESQHMHRTTSVSTTTPRCVSRCPAGEPGLSLLGRVIRSLRTQLHLIFSQTGRMRRQTRTCRQYIHTSYFVKLILGLPRCSQIRREN
ncbi:hypothetical protein C8J57DRAFT_1705932 [Mycena rebaudengoi]|nr:hypothetical protein C8J57DRAFT_1705932 [Mycena rebaudengoi]